jgi:hypothetical protein
MVSGGSNGWRRKTTDSRGPPVGEGKRGSGVPFRERLDGPWAPFLIWAEGSPEAFLYFYFLFFFSFSEILISFIDFAYLIQIKPNQFHKFCKIHSKVLN